MPNVRFRGIPHLVPRRLRSSAATTALLIISTTAGWAQILAPSKLATTVSKEPAKKDSIQVITREAPEVIVRETPQMITKEPQVVTKEKQTVVTKDEAQVVTKQTAEVVTKPKPQVVKKEKAPQIMTPISEPIRPIASKITTTPTSESIGPIAHYSFKTPEGRRESVQVITHYYPNQIVYPLAKADRHLDPKLMRAASIAQERAHAHSRSLCWHYVKEALLASGVIDSRPKSEFARDAADDLVINYGFKKLSVRDPFAAPIGSVLVYGTSRSVGHVEIRTKDGFVSDFRSPTPSRRPLIGVYAKL